VLHLLKKRAKLLRVYKPKKTFLSLGPQQRKRTAPSTHTVVQEAPGSSIASAAQERQKKKLQATVTETPMVVDKSGK
jgi:hypothetical protein